MAMPDAHQSCDKLLNLIRESNLNFLIQETPFSAFITVRKSLCRKSRNEVENAVISWLYLFKYYICFRNFIKVKMTKSIRVSIMTLLWK